MESTIKWQRMEDRLHHQTNPALPLTDAEIFVETCCKSRTTMTVLLVATLQETLSTSFGGLVAMSKRVPRFCSSNEWRRHDRSIFCPSLHCVRDVRLALGYVSIPVNVMGRRESQHSRHGRTVGSCWRVLSLFTHEKT